MTEETTRHARLLREALSAPELYQRQREALAAAYAAGGVDPLAEGKTFERAWVEAIVDAYLLAMREREETAP